MWNYCFQSGRQHLFMFLFHLVNRTLNQRKISARYGHKRHNKIIKPHTLCTVWCLYVLYILLVNFKRFTFKFINYFLHIIEWNIDLYSRTEQNGCHCTLSLKSGQNHTAMTTTVWPNSSFVHLFIWKKLWYDINGKLFHSFSNPFETDF